MSFVNRATKASGSDPNQHVCAQPLSPKGTTARHGGWKVHRSAHGYCSDASPDGDCWKTTLGPHWVPEPMALQVPQELGWNSSGQDDSAEYYFLRSQNQIQNRAALMLVVTQSNSNPRTVSWSEQVCVIKLTKANFSTNGLLWRDNMNCFVGEVIIQTTAKDLS